jgi:rhamnose transport system ATP-binding protein
MPTRLLRLNNITKSFGAVRALKSVSFELVKGEVHALVGENGAGKSTLIKIITGAHQPDSGTIEVGAETVPHLTPNTSQSLGVACVYQQAALFPDLTVAENIGLRLDRLNGLQRVHWNARRKRAAELLHRVGANIDVDAEVRQLSMPDQQLVEICCAVGTGARIILMDEPTASLTQKEQHLLFAVIRELRSIGVGIIYISHRLEEVLTLADRVTVLRDGHSVSTNSIDNVTERSLIQSMVGHDVSFNSRADHSSLGKVVLDLREVSCACARISNVSLEIRAGQIVGLAGMIGAGRTELARVIFGITPADSGEIRLNDQPVTIRSPQNAVAHGIAYVPEDRRRHGVILDLPISHNMSLAIHERLFPGTWLRFDRERQLAVDYVQKLSVKTSGPDATAHSLSGGNQQKVSLARWLATEPKVLILDEPTQGVDIAAKAEIHQIIRSLAIRGLAVLLISSDLPEVLTLSDRIAVMRAGTIVEVLPGGSNAHDVLAAALGQKGVPV